MMAKDGGCPQRLGQDYTAVSKLQFVVAYESWLLFVSVVDGPALVTMRIRILLYLCKKRLSIFPSPAGMSLTKLSLAGQENH